MIENNDLNRDLLKLSFLQRVQPISKSRLRLENFMPSDDELTTIVQEHREELKECIEADDLIKYLKSENIALSEFLSYQVYLLNNVSADVYQEMTLGFMYRLAIAKKCKELYDRNFYCVYPIPNLD